MAEQIGCHITVTGRVQGVGFRYYCRDAASRLGLKGYVMNMPDGLSVELEVFGDADLIGSFLDAVTEHGGMFDIEDVKKTGIPYNKVYRDFYIQHYPGY
jgi:acylphosphatase